MLVDTDTEQRNTQTFTLSNLRFEPESDGYITVWFDLGGPAFEEPEAMTNMFVEFDELLKHVAQHHPAMYEVLADGSPGHSAWLERLEAADFDWSEKTPRPRFTEISNIPGVMEKERISWLLARRAREEGPATQVQFDADWQRLSARGLVRIQLGGRRGTTRSSTASIWQWNFTRNCWITTKTATTACGI